MVLSLTSTQNAERAEESMLPDDITLPEIVSRSLSDSRVTMLPFLCLTLRNLKDKTRAGRMTRLVKAPASKPDALSLIPKSHVI